MLRFLKIFPFLIFGLLQAQEEKVQSVYFQFDKFNLDEKQANDVINFIKNITKTE